MGVSGVSTRHSVDLSETSIIMIAALQKLQPAVTPCAAPGSSHQ